MENPSVTLHYREANAAGGILVVIGLLAAVLNTVLPSGNAILGYVIAGIALVLAVVFFCMAKGSKTLDQDGICIRGIRSKKRFSWQSVERVTILPDRGKSFPPAIELRIAGQRGALEIDYTRRTLACVLRYYGQPDADQWGKPPTMS